MHMPRWYIAAAALACLLVAPEAYGAGGVQVGSGTSRVEADPDAGAADVKESGSLPFVETASAGGATAAQNTTVADDGTGIVLQSTHDINASNANFGFSRMNRTFTVTAQGVTVRLSGSMSDSQSMGLSADQRVVFRRIGGGTIHDFNDADNPTFSASGELEPGTYELEIDGACSPPASTTCSADLNVRLELTGVPVDHYRVELKAWIPKAHVAGVPPVVDVPFLSPQPFMDDCFEPPGLARQFNTTVATNFRGDNHPVYDGSFRVRPVAEFDWDGERISNFRASPGPENFGTTHLDYVYSAPGFDDVACTQEKTVTEAASAAATSDNAFAMSMKSANPLAFGAPPIDSQLRGTLSPEGGVAIEFSTDLFPSHGIRIERNGAPLDTRIVNDVSCIPDESALGLTGAGLLSYGLSRHANQGSYSVAPTGPPTTVATPGQLCSGEYVTVEAIETGGASGASAAATSVQVAPLVGGSPGEFISLGEAIERGLVGAETAGGTRLGVDIGTPVVLRLRGRRLLLQVDRVERGAAQGPVLFGPAKGTLRVRLGETTRVTAGRRRLRARRPDRRPPRTRAVVRRRGSTATVRLRAKDPSGVDATFALVNDKVARVRKGRLRVPVRLLGSVRFYSVDSLGNRERPRRLPPARRR